MDVDDLTAAELSTPLIEGTMGIVVPKRGKLFESDGTFKAAIIRPCVSRGRRVRGLPPIYTPSMLAENASVFTNWPMFMDHLREELAEELQSLLEARGRGISELGGRIVESWWDTELRMPGDDSRGYKPGGVVGRVLPQPAIRAMVEADPELLHLSIAAWPTGAKPGQMWGQQGMVIEGIRKDPPGSVDFVIRGGAGGRVLIEDERLAVSLVEAAYDSHRPNGGKVTQISDMNLDQLREHLAELNPAVHSQLFESTPSATTGVTADQLSELLQEHQDALEAKLEEHGGLVEERAVQLANERDLARRHEKIAHTMIREASGLTPGFRAELSERYSVLPSGPAPILLTEDQTVDGMEFSAEDVLRFQVKEDIETTLARITEARGGPAVRGQGSGGTEQTNGKQPVNAFREFMLESGGFDKPEDIDKIMGD